MISKTQTQTKPEPRKQIKGIKPTEPETDQITYNLFTELIHIITYNTNDPRIITETAEELQQYIKPETIPTKTVKLEELTDKEFIDSTFEDLYIKEESKGLTDTTITPEQYNYKILELIKKTIEEETGEKNNIKIIDSNTIQIKNSELLRVQIEYINSDLYTNIKTALNSILYHLDENPEVIKELEQFIYLNSYYKD